MNKKNITLLRLIIKETISILFEGHGGQISYGLDTRRLFGALAEYSSARKTSPPTPDLIGEFLNKINRVSGASQTLRAYSIVDNDRTSPVYKAMIMLDRGMDPRTVSQFGTPDFKLIEKQIMKVLGAEFMVKDDPGSGFDMFFGAPLDWRGTDVDAQKKSKRSVAI